MARRVKLLNQFEREYDALNSIGADTIAEVLVFFLVRYSLSFLRSRETMRRLYIDAIWQVGIDITL